MLERPEEYKKVRGQMEWISLVTDTLLLCHQRQIHLESNMNNTNPLTQMDQLNIDMTTTATNTNAALEAEGKSEVALAPSGIEPEPEKRPHTDPIPAEVSMVAPGNVFPRQENDEPREVCSEKRIRAKESERLM